MISETVVANLSKFQIATELKKLQDRICSQLEDCDGKAKFQEELWDRSSGGSGRTRVIQNGAVFEKGGVNFSEVFGKATPSMLKALDLKESNNLEFFATGVSIVLHPASPMVPISHANFRYFELSNGMAWIGGGIDLTPIYVVPEQAQWFHQQLKDVCNRHDERFYPKFKSWADDYFYIEHRQETRGIGGVFFDHLTPSEHQSLPELIDFLIDLGNKFAPIYTQIINWNRHLIFSEEQKKWQLIRRGRYAEFNLVYDRGTKFGFESQGRTESILMSLPPQANWEYNHVPHPGSEEAKTLSLLKKNIEW
ncbi:oxygen-dependent coproporphyrinogen oxidase [Aquirufa sp. ROCK2-A2]